MLLEEVEINIYVSSAKFNQKLPPNPIWFLVFTTFFDSAWVNFAFVLHVLTCYARCLKKMSLGRKNEGF